MISFLMNNLEELQTRARSLYKAFHFELHHSSRAQEKQSYDMFGNGRMERETAMLHVTVVPLVGLFYSTFSFCSFLGSWNKFIERASCRVSISHLNIKDI